MTIVTTGVIILVFHIIYFAFLIIPAISFLLFSRNSIIRLFQEVPKEVSGKIYQDIQERDDSDHKYVGIANPTTVIVIWYTA